MKPVVFGGFFFAFVAGWTWRKSAKGMQPGSLNSGSSLRGHREPLDCVASSIVVSTDSPCGRHRIQRTLLFHVLFPVAERDLPARRRAGCRALRSAAAVEASCIPPASPGARSTYLTPAPQTHSLENGSAPLVPAFGSQTRTGQLSWFSVHVLNIYPKMQFLVEAPSKTC